MGWNKGFICMIDALGTKGRWKHESPESFLFFMSTIREALNRTNNDLYEKENCTYGFPKLKMNFLSDTLIITQNTETQDEKDISFILQRFTKHLSGLISSSFIFNIFFRGVVSYGEYLQDEYCLIGPAVDDAASMYETPQLIGVVLHKNVNPIIKDHIDLYNTLLNHFLINYVTPCKDKIGVIWQEEHYNVNWPKMLTFTQKDENINSRNYLINQFSKTPTPDANAKRKLDNTLSFFDYSLNNSEKLMLIE